MPSARVLVLVAFVVAAATARADVISLPPSRPGAQGAAQPPASKPEPPSSSCAGGALAALGPALLLLLVAALRRRDQLQAA